MPELLQSCLIFAGLQLLVFSSANHLIWRFFSDECRDLFDWLLLMFLLVSGQILAILAVAGFASQLNLPVVSGLTVVAFFLFGSPRGHLKSWGQLRQLVFRREGHDGHDWIWGIYGFLVLFGMIELFNAFVQFPWEYDTIAYHMPIVVEWLQTGTLWDVFYAVWGGPLGYYPSNHELLLTWLILPFGNDILVNLANFWIIGIMVTVIYKILKEMGVEDFLAWLAGALVMVMPIFLRQMGTGQVDTLMALGILIAWYYFLRTFKRKDGLLLVPLLMTLSLTLGSKYLAIIYLIPVMVVFVFLSSYWRKQSRWWWLWSLGILGSLGSLWYWRNLILTGNPIFPAEVSLGDWVIFQGYTGLTERIQELSLWHRVTESGQWSEWTAAMTKETGWHLYLVVIAYVMLVVEMVSKLFVGHLKRGEGKIYTLMLFFLPAYWYLYFIAPYTASMMEHNVRYAMPWLMLSMIMVVYVIHKLGSSRKAFVMALVGIISWQFLTIIPMQRIGEQDFLELHWVHQYPSLFGLLCAMIVMVFLFFEQWRRRYWMRYPAFVLMILLGFVFLQQVMPIRSEIRHEVWQHQYAFPLMKAHEWLDEHAAADARIANSLNPLYYPLYGEELSRRVRYININDCGECDYYGYQQQGMTVRDHPSYEDWLHHLRDFGADYLVLGYSITDGLEDVPAHEIDWAAEHPDVFEPVFEEDGVTIYQLKKTS